MTGPAIRTPAPTEIGAFRRHAEWALAVAVAIEAGILREAAERPVTPAAVAEALELDPRAVRILCGVLVAAGALREEPQGLRATGTARALWIDRDTPDHERNALHRWLGSIRRWATELEVVLREGGPAPGHRGPESRDPEALRRFMAAMDAKDPERVGRVVDALLERAPRARRALDVGGGPGTFARALAGRGVETVLVDRPEVLEHVRDAYGLASAAGIELWPGDFLEALPDGPFDLVLLANITHIYGAGTNRALLERLAGRLAPGGVLGIVDFVRDRSAFAPLFAVTMLLATEEGDTWPLEAYRGWLAAAGLEAVRCLELGGDAQVVTAVRGRG